MLTIVAPGSGTSSRSVIIPLVDWAFKANVKTIAEKKLVKVLFSFIL
jgi:hypothetical protein